MGKGAESQVVRVERASEGEEIGVGGMVAM